MSVPEHFRRVLVLGGARSGKSAFAEQLAAELGEPVLYVATAVASDAEMAERIQRHQARRPRAWRTLEEPRRVADKVEGAATDACTVLVEDLTILLSNLMLDGHDPVQDDELELAAGAAERDLTDQLDQLVRLPCHLVLVSNEVGMGLVPAYPMGRVFRDALGRVHQHAAARADEVYLVVAGLPTRLKPRNWRMPRLEGAPQ